jgi:hypothetical protein
VREGGVADVRLGVPGFAIGELRDEARHVAQLAQVFFYAGEVTFKQSLSIVSWPFLAVTLVSMPLTLLVLYLKEDWNVDPRTALQANLTLLLDRGSVPRAVYSIAESLDLFSAWALALLSMGYAAATGRRAGQAAIGVAAMWALYVLGKAALSAVF